MCEEMGGERWVRGVHLLGIVPDTVPSERR